MRSANSQLRPNGDARQPDGIGGQRQDVFAGVLEDAEVVAAAVVRISDRQREVREPRPRGVRCKRRAGCARTAPAAGGSESLTDES